MATFTTVQKHKLSWQAPESVVTGEPEVDFVFSDDTDFLFSDTSDFVFRSETQSRAATAWSGLPKERSSWQAPQTVSTGTPELDFVFSDSSDFVFSDLTDFVFREETSERLPTVWTRLTKNR